ncbi:MAG: hypothetical protein JWO28_771, partial [Hyphomicrobiales bacterium]|nr:hypothetical protein [Hyphomicrobiales bacterium]
SERALTNDILDKFFHARSLAIVGASTDPNKLGGRPIRQNLQLGFAGRLLPVNPSSPEVQGVPAFASIEALPDDVDCAVIALPYAGVEAAVDALARKHVPLAIVLSSGFAEYSDEGLATQQRIVARAHEAGMRLIGPNSMGGISFESRMSATFTSINEHENRAFPQLGGISIASQSGFVGSHLMGLMRDRGLGVAKWLATGNQADVDLADCIAHYARDEVTKIIAVYLEGAGRADALREAFDLARAAGKPVVALKAGRTELGARAVASHTASLVGGAEAYEAIFHRHGVVGAASLDELIDVVAALDTGRAPKGPHLGVGTVSGGFGILISDAAAENGFDIPELSPERQARVRKAYPLASTRNPVDMGSLARFEHAVEALLEEDYDSVLLVAGHFGLLADQIAGLRDHLAKFRVRYPGSFIGLVATLTDHWRREFQQLGVFTCDDPARAVRAMGLVRGVAARGRSDVPDKLPHVADFDVSGLMERGDERAARAVMRAIGVPVVEDELAVNASGAVALAQRMGGRLVFKIASPDILHKSDIGGVRLGVTEADAEDAFEQIMSRARAAHPQARIDGVIVSPMIEGGIETIVGVKRDEVFGPIVMFGLGGVFVEVFRDTAVAVAPFGRETALEMIRSVKSYPLLAGARGRPAADIDALADALARISVFARRNEHLVDSIDVNPLLALPDGVVALDALVVPRLS